MGVGLGKHGNAISCILNIQICSKLKFMLTLLVFEIKEGKTAQNKSKKILTIIYHYLLEEDSNGHVCGGILPQKIFEI
jgi:hypothetical protein